MVVNEKRHRNEAQEWYFHLMNDPNELEKCRYTDTINDYNILIAEFQNCMSKHLQQITLCVLDNFCH
jgi:hypothetical protein